MPSTPLWVLERQESNNRVAYCATRNRWVIGSGTTLKDSADGFEYATVTYPFSDNIIGIAGTDTGSTRGSIVVITQSNSRIYELDNAGNWSNVTPTLAGTYNQIVYLPGIGFLVLGVRLGNPVNWLSTDGVNWTGPYTHNFGNSVVYKGTPGFICSIDGGTAVDYSPDGVSWTLRLGGLGTKLIRQVAYVAPLAKWIGFAYDAGQTDTWAIQCDADGTNFTVIHDFGSFISPKNIIYEPHSGYLVLICLNDTLISTDGISWSSIGMIDPNGFSSVPLGINNISGQIIVLGLSGGTWSPNDNIMAMIMTDDVNPFSTWTVDGTLNPVTGLNVTGGNGNPYDVSFTANNPKPPDVYATRTTNADGSGGKTVSSIVNPGGSNAFSFTDNLTDQTGKKIFEVFAVNSTNRTISVVESFTVGADVAITGSGGVTFGGSATITFKADPSGLYVLTATKTHDTIYDRQPGGDTYDVAIPNPYFKLGYINGE